MQPKVKLLWLWDNKIQAKPQQQHQKGVVKKKEHAGIFSVRGWCYFPDNSYPKNISDPGVQSVLASTKGSI